jgi:hypothetical protein
MLCLAPSAKAGVRSKRGAVQPPYPEARTVGYLLPCSPLVASSDKADLCMQKPSRFVSLDGLCRCIAIARGVPRRAVLERGPGCLPLNTRPLKRGSGAYQIVGSTMPDNYHLYSRILCSSQHYCPIDAISTIICTVCIHPFSLFPFPWWSIRAATHSRSGADEKISYYQAVYRFHRGRRCGISRRLGAVPSAVALISLTAFPAFERTQFTW